MRFSKAPSPCFTLRMFHPCAEMCERHRCDFSPVTVHWREGFCGGGREEMERERHSNRDRGDGERKRRHNIKARDGTIAKRRGIKRGIRKEESGRMR